MKNKTIAIVLAVALMFIACPVVALQGQEQGQIGINENENTNQQGQGQKQGQIGINEQDQGQVQGQIGINEQNQTATGGDAQQSQGQAMSQGQIGVVKGKQANTQSTTVEGDDINTYVMTAPNTVAGDGQTAFSGYSIFGGINLAESAEYKICIEKIRTVSQMAKAGLMSKEEAVAEAREAFEQLKDASRPKRILSFGPKTRGRHIFNLFGMIATDSAY